MNTLNDLIDRWNTNEGKQFFFLPMFGFASPDDIPERPSDYGVVA